MIKPVDDVPKAFIRKKFQNLSSLTSLSFFKKKFSLALLGHFLQHFKIYMDENFCKM